MELVDGLTGRTVENLAIVPGALQALVVAGDGIVVLRPAVLGTRLVAIGFDIGFRLDEWIWRIT